MLTGRCETVTAVSQLGCFLAALTVHTEALRKHIFKNQESYDHEWFLPIFILQPEPKGAFIVGSFDWGGASVFLVTLSSGCRFSSSLLLFQVPGESERQWKPALVVLTEKDLLIYDSMPRRKEAWFNPVHTYPLLATR